MSFNARHRAIFYWHLARPLSTIQVRDLAMTKRAFAVAADSPIVPLCRPSASEDAARSMNGWSGEAVPERSVAKRTAALGRLSPPELGVHISGVQTKARSRQAFRLKGVEYQVSPANGYEKPELPNYAAQSAGLRDPAFNKNNYLTN